MPRVEGNVTLYNDAIVFYELIQDREEQNKMAIAMMRWLSGDDSERLVEFFNSSPQGRQIYKNLRRAVGYTEKKNRQKKKPATLPEGYVDPNEQQNDS